MPETRGFFINHRGKRTVNIRDSGVAGILTGFREGRAAVCGTDDRCGFIDVSGHICVEPRFSHVEDYSEGLAKVELDNRAGFIDHDDRLVIPPFVESREWIDNNLGCFAEGYAPFRVNGAWGFVDISGQPVIEPAYNEAFGFCNGRARVRKQLDWGYVDTSGRFERDPIARLSFNDGLACDTNGFSLGYRDHSGNWVITPEYDEALPFACGRALVRRRSETLVIDLTGRTVFVVEASRGVRLASYYSEGVLPSVMYLDGEALMGYRGSEGDWVLPPRFRFAAEFSEGLAWVEER